MLRSEETGELRRLHNEELNLYWSPKNFRVIKSRKMRWARHVAHMGRGKAYTGFWFGKPEGRRLLGRPRCRWEDNINPFMPHVPLLEQY
jgi:hypothetical protein